MEKGFLSWLGGRTDWTELTWRKVSSAASVAEKTGLSLRGERFPQLGLVAEQTVHQQIWSWRYGQFN